MENFNQFADRIQLRFHCVECGQEVVDNFLVPSPNLDEGDNSRDTENTSEEHCQCSNCRHGYDVDIMTNELDGMVVVSDNQYNDIETISVQSIFEEEEEEDLPQDIIKPSHIITVCDISTDSKNDVFEQVYQEYMDNYRKGIEPTIAFVNSKTITKELAKILFGQLLIRDKVPYVVCKNLQEDNNIYTVIFEGVKEIFTQVYPHGLKMRLTPEICIMEPQVEIINGGLWKQVQLGMDVIEALNS